MKNIASSNGPGRSVLYDFRRMLLIALLSLTLAVLLTGCNEEVTYTRVSVFVDLTEIEERDGTLLSEVNEIEKLLNLVSDTSRNHRNNGGSISLYSISDESLLSIPFVKKLELGSPSENALMRNQKVRAFLEEARTEFDEVIRGMVSLARAPSSNNLLNEYEQSQILRPICEYLTRADPNVLSDGLGYTVRHYVVIFSDLLENSSLYSFYRDGGGSGDKDVQEKVADTFASECEVFTQPLTIEYQIFTHPLGRGNSEISELQRHALLLWRKVLAQLGLQENNALLG